MIYTDKTQNPLLRYAEDGRLERRLRAYLRSCQPSEGEDGKRVEGRLANFAGFCASLGCGRQALEGLRRANPAVYDHLAAVLEDEALNSTRSPAIVNAYIKENFAGIGREVSEKEAETRTGGTLRVVVEHDLLEDGG